MLFAALIGIISVLLALAAGYLLGVGRSATTRDRLWAQSLAHMEGLRHERQILSERQGDRVSDLLREDLDKLIELQQRQGNELQRLVRPLSSATGGTGNLRSTVKQAFAPFTHHERLNSALSNMGSGTDREKQLGLLLDEVATNGGFRTVVLSDEQGLPLASSDNAEGIDRLLGIAAYLLILAERFQREGTPRPLSLVVHDEKDQLILSHIIHVRDTQLILTGETTGAYPTPTVLDKQEETLSDEH